MNAMPKNHLQADVVFWFVDTEFENIITITSVYGLKKKRKKKYDVALVRNGGTKIRLKRMECQMLRLTLTSMVFVV